jgi:hypothetical protein
MLGYDVEIFEANGEKTISTSYPNIIILLEGPGPEGAGRGTKERREAPLPPRQRRLGGWYHAGPGGTVERVVCNTRAGEMPVHGTLTAQIRANESGGTTMAVHK